MKPIEWITLDNGRIRLACADCLDVLPTLEAGIVDAVVTDPPYGVDGAILNPNRNTNGKRHNTWFEKPDWDSEIDPRWCEACCRAAGTVAWFGNWKRRDEVSAAMLHPIRCEIIWAKDTHVGPPCPAAMRDERIWWFAAAGLDVSRFETTVWDEPIIPTWAYRHHRNEKPIPLMVRAVSWINARTILDPFMGSGTTGVACVRLDRQFIGVEKEKRDFDIAVDRIRAELSRTPLFSPPKAVQRELIP